jgi:tRNA pseudouridine38-40 synthase
VQGVLVRALVPLAGPDVRVVGASRTDAGVHALGQVAGVVAGRAILPEVAVAALNARLPTDVRVLAARVPPEGFHARRSARLKRYGYVLDTGPIASPLRRCWAWHVGGPLDVAAMRRELRALRGRHDFSAFRAAAGRDRDPVCRLHSVRVVARGSLVGILVSADSFLHHMVRNIVGSVLEVGRGRRPPGWLASVLASRDRRRAGVTAPARGLFLLSVRYPAPLFPGGRHLAECWPDPRAPRGPGAGGHVSQAPAGTGAAGPGTGSRSPGRARQ